MIILHSISKCRTLLHCTWLFVFGVKINIFVNVLYNHAPRQLTRPFSINIHYISTTFYAESIKTSVKIINILVTKIYVKGLTISSQGLKMKWRLSWNIRLIIMSLTLAKHIIFKSEISLIWLINSLVPSSPKPTHQSQDP